jgi:RAQPRD family integrative conjugative element protein
METMHGTRNCGAMTMSVCARSCIAVLAALALVCLGSAALAQGNVDAEREALARLIHEMDALAPLIDAAENHANPDARIRFQYGWLRQDIERIKFGIREHLEAPRSEPRPVPPLRGDYRR